MTNCFELHLGIPDNVDSVGLAYEMLRSLREKTPPGTPSWTFSDVKAVFVKNPGCFDPHNVPGTLRCLLSRELPVWDNLATLDALIEHQVCTSAASVLDELHVAALADARLEVEYPFGCLDMSHDTRGRLVRRALVGDAITIEPERLQLKGGFTVPNTPKWEIHFVVERRNSSTTGLLTIEDVPAIIEQHSVDIEQTIEYRSQSMHDRGSDDYKFISTSYYGSAGETEAEGRRLFYHTSLCDDFAARGYSVKLILEHIVACFQPRSGIAALADALQSTSGDLVNAR